MITVLPRRQFLKTTTTATAFTLLPSGLLSSAPNSRLRTAHIGVGGMGGADLRSIASHPRVEVAALCDIDQTRLDAAHRDYPNAERYSDFREMMAQRTDNIDAVVVSTPDHTHAPAAMTALNAGKPVYCQKPLTHDVYEARQLRIRAAHAGVPTQMGIQVHSSQTYRRAVEIIQQGTIGAVSQVHAWSSKNWGYDGVDFTNVTTPPENIDWDLWIGSATMRPFVPGVYHPAQWRKLIDFGTGTLGDMGVHIFDTPYAALELTDPLWVKTNCRIPTSVGHPEKNRVQYAFPGTRFTTDSLLWTWYDGADAPPLPEKVGLPKDFPLPSQGSLFTGEDGIMLLPHVGEAQLIPEDKFKNFKPPVVSNINHYHQWVDACLGKGHTNAGFDYAGPLTESLLLGVVANRFPDTTLQWDASKGQVTNLDEANAPLRRSYRPEFGVANL